MDLFVSPHLDDAVFSCGEQIYRCDAATVVTVFAGGDEQRRTEDRHAAVRLGFIPVWGDLLDDSLRDGPADPALIALLLAPLMAEADAVYVPLGVTHPDHVIVSDVARELSWTCDRPPILYEELPYRVEQPIETYDRINALALRIRADCDVPPRGDAAMKLSAIEAYGSQIQGRDLHALLVDERFWRLRAPRED